MFTETIEALNRQIEEAKAKLAELEAKKKAIMDMESRMSAVVQEISNIAKELEIYPDMLINFERSIRDTIRPHKREKDNLQKFNNIGLVNLKNTRNPNVKFYTNDEGTEIYSTLIGINDKRLAKKWADYFADTFSFSSELFSGSWTTEHRYTLGLIDSDITTIDDESIHKLLEFNFLQAPPDKITHLPKKPYIPQPQPQPQPQPTHKSA